jgi:hypothetical protein
LDSVIGGFILVHSPEEGKPGSGRNSVEYSKWLLKLLEYPILSTQVHSPRILMDKEASMDNREWTNNVDEELEASNEERKILTLIVNSISSTKTFTCWIIERGGESVIEH